MTDTFRWRLAIGAVLIAGGYGAWLIILRGRVWPKRENSADCVPWGNTA